MDKGSDNGIMADMAVITPKGLIGRTTEVSRHTATVLLISDPTCRVSCKLARTGAFGIMRGGGVSVGGEPELVLFCTPRSLRMDYISKDQKIFESDKVITSGLGGVYPEGLPIGIVARMDMDPSGLYQRAEIVPDADLSDLRYVFVVQH